MTKQRFFRMILLVCACNCYTRILADKEQNQFLTVPKMDTSPTIDGKIESREWEQASMVTGLANFKNKSLAPEIQQSHWWFGFDDQHLYVAVRSAIPPGCDLVTRAKKSYVAGGNKILYDDHIELEIIPSDNPVIGTTRGFYKWMLNSRDTVSECHYIPREGLMKDNWRSEFTYRSVVNEKTWDLEMAIPVKAMNIKKIENGMKWLCWFARCSDPCYAFFFAWEPVAYKTFASFPILKFDDTAPSVQISQIGEILKGNLDLKIKMTAAEIAADDVAVNVMIKDGSGKKLLEEKQNIVLRKDESRDLVFRKNNIPISQVNAAATSKAYSEYNRIHINITRQEGDKTTELLRYSARFACLNADFQKFWVDRWLKGMTVCSDYGFDSRYFPYADKLEVWVDTDIQGVTKDVRQAATLRVAVFKKSSQKPLVRNDVPINKSGYARTVMDIPMLTEGEYKIVATLLNTSGSLVGKPRIIAFERKNFPWEHNNIGMEDTVFSPFTPVMAKDNKIRTLGKIHTIGKMGLFQQVETDPHLYNAADGGRQIKMLRTPIWLEAFRDGKTFYVEGGSPEITHTKPTAATVEAHGELANIQVSTRCTMEFDGLYMVELTLDPKKTVTLDGLDLVIEPPKKMDWFGVERVMSHPIGRLPQGAGVVWESRNMTKDMDVLGTFCPLAWIGWPDRFVEFVAESDENWILDDNVSCIKYLRDKTGAPSLRISFINKKTVLDKPRTIRFGFLVNPFRPEHPKARYIAWDWKVPETPSTYGEAHGYFYHDYAGGGYWGAGKNVLNLPSDNAYKALKKFLIKQKRKVGLRDDAPSILYSSHQLIGASQDEVLTRSYAGEWLNTMTPKIVPEMKPVWNYGRTIEYKTDDQRCLLGFHWSKSYVDMRVYYYDKLMRKLGLNGTYYDNFRLFMGCNPLAGNAYVREDGQVQMKYNIFLLREYMMRLWRQHQKYGIEPYHFSFTGYPPLNNVIWLLEGKWFVDSWGPDLIDAIGIDGAIDPHTMGGSIRQGEILLYPPPSPDIDMTSRKRTAHAMMLLNDIGNCRRMRYPILEPRLLGLLNSVNFFNAVFVPFWRNEHMVRIEHPDWRVSVYRTVLNRKVLYAFVVVNGSDKDGGSVLRIAGNLPGLKLSELYDLETLENLTPSLWHEKTADGKVSWIGLGLPVKRHDYRIIIAK